MKYAREAFADVIEGLCRYEIWLMLGWAEIRLRYRRSTLGPFWLTISMGITIGAMGPLYGQLFNQDNNAAYMASLAVGLVIWTLISGIVTETSNGFIAAEGYIKEFNLPLSIYVLRVVWRNFIVFAHNMVVVVVVLLFYRPSWGWSLISFPFALFVIAFNGLTLGLLLGVACTRFRDVQLIVASILQVVFFVTPIIWSPAMLGRKAWLLNFNPAYLLIESVRGPLLGYPVNTSVWLGIAVTTMLSTFMAMLIYGKYRYRVAYWL